MTIVALRPDRLGLDAFITELLQAAWFAACGAPLIESECAEATSLVAAMGFAGQAIEPVADWHDAAQVTQRADWSRAWWDAEAKAEAALTAAAVAQHGEEAMLAGLSRVTEAALTLQGAAALGLSRGGIADQALTRVASGSAAQACHQAALARLLAGDDGTAHPFTLKYRLFAAGRWPLGLVGDRFYLF